LFLTALGSTPQRREFQYPRHLTKTGNHGQILEDFRTKYYTDEAVNTALPYESEHEVCLCINLTGDLYSTSTKSHKLCLCLLPACRVLCEWSIEKTGNALPLVTLQMNFDVLNELENL